MDPVCLFSKNILEHTRTLFIDVAHWLIGILSSKIVTSAIGKYIQLLWTNTFGHISETLPEEKLLRLLWEQRAGKKAETRVTCCCCRTWLAWLTARPLKATHWSLVSWAGFFFTNVFLQTTKHICPNPKMYLSKSRNVFVWVKNVLSWHHGHWHTGQPCVFLQIRLQFSNAGHLKPMLHFLRSETSQLKTLNAALSLWAFFSQPGECTHKHLTQFYGLYILEI